MYYRPALREAKRADAPAIPEPTTPAEHAAAIAALKAVLPGRVAPKE